MYRDLVSFVVRRAVCGLENRNYNNLFMAGVRELRRNGVTPTRLRQWLSSGNYDWNRWPTDAEFEKACASAPLYPGHLDTQKARALLTELEGALRRSSRSEEPVAPALVALDVDHILPQSWFKYWPLPDGAVATLADLEAAKLVQLVGQPLQPSQQSLLDRQAAVPRLGNLTLLHYGVNREAQHKAFSIKRDLLLANSTLRLNVELIAQGSWDEACIAQRGAKLADVAINLYPSPAESGPLS